MAHEPTLIASVQRALHLLDAVDAADRPLPAKVLARRTGQPLATTYHPLRTLVHEGYLDRVDVLGYVLGDRIPALSGGPGRAATVVAQAHQVLRALHVEASAATYLSMLDDGGIRLTEAERGVIDEGVPRARPCRSRARASRGPPHGRGQAVRRRRGAPAG